MNQPINVDSPWVYRWSLLVTLLTFPLIWLGGLVTTHDAGMAVPDWPGTFGYNLFLYPLSTWLFGPFDLFVEHGHRLLASLVGLIAIGLCVVALKTEKRAWLKYVCFALLLSIIAQGVLGGVRVLFDARTLAMIHGCSGPLVFALASFIVMASSTTWQTSTANERAGWMGRISWLLLVLAIVQLFVGAHLRHSLPTWKPVFFMSLVHTHLLMATLITLMICVLFVMAWAGSATKTRLFRAPAALLVLVVLAQVVLGFATWIANYATPWVELTPWLARYTVQGKGFWESMIVTGHQATGSLLIVFSLWMVCRVYRSSQLDHSSHVTDTSAPTYILSGETPVAISAGAE
jgi:cytochrome c oxidase assembly protein subunit 15